MNEYLEMLNAVKSEQRNVRKLQDGGSTTPEVKPDYTIGTSGLPMFKNRDVRKIGNKVYLMPFPGEDIQQTDKSQPNYSTYLSDVNEFLNSKELNENIRSTNRNIEVGDISSDEGQAELQKSLNSNDTKSRENRYSTTTTTQEYLDRQSKINKVGAGFAAYNSTVGTYGNMIGVNRVNNDMAKNDIYMNQNLRSSGSYGNVQENVNNANDHSKQQQIMAGRDAMINNISSMGPYGAMIGAGLQTASTIMDSSGITGNLFNRQTAAQRSEAERQKNVAEGIISEGKDVTNAGQNGSGYATAMNKLNGDQQTKIAIGQDGMEIPENGDRHELVNLEDSSYNVIPSGSLHSDFHHLGANHPEYMELTRKGIPVISEEKDGILQHAEIERGEIILRLALTERLIDLMNDGSYEAQVEAGKLLTDELMHNTRDNIGLIKSLKKNGQVQG